MLLGPGKVLEIFVTKRVGTLDGCCLPSLFSKLEILTSGPVQRPNMHHRAKFRTDWSNCFGDMANWPIGHFLILCSIWTAEYLIF